MKLSSYDLQSLFTHLRNFSYKELDPETNLYKIVNIEMFPSNMTSMMTIFFKKKYGDLRAQDIMEDYKKGDISAEELAECIKYVCGQKWHRFLQAWELQYNPLFNVDGTEERIIETEYGKITTMTKGTTSTTEQLEDSYSEITYGSTNTQTNDLENTSETVYGRQEKTTNNLSNSSSTTYGKTTTNSVVPFDGNTFLDKDKSVDSGIDSITGSNTGDITIKLSDKDKVTDTNTGSITNESSGTDSTMSHNGKSQLTITGDDTDTNSGKDTVKDTLKRAGNIGVTKSTELIKDHIEVWKNFDLFDLYFKSIAEEISIPIYESEEDTDEYYFI